MIPLSFGQQRLWFLAQLVPDNPFYNVSRVWRLRGALDRRALRLALDGLVVRHERLRTTFASRDGRPVQVVAGEGLVLWDETDLRNLSSGLYEVERLVAVSRVRPFDLTVGPLFRAELFV